jgi:(E)-4-hydroxy-3-methylbut-2-enyl-diphosphate synthase
LAKYGAATAEALCESALYHISLLEKFNFYDTVVSMKASSVSTMIAANRLLAEALKAVELVETPLYDLNIKED